METDLIKINNISKVYENNTRALDDLNLIIKEGSWTSIMGPSGSGKTTLINIIGCLDSPSHGQVSIDGTEITALGQKQLTKFRRENIGLIFQQYHLVLYLSALDNVMLAQYYHSVVNRKDAEEALKRVGLGHRLHHIPAHLSGGEQQRVCIARALINDPRILIADAPTGYLDSENGRNVLDLIKELHQEGHTVILVTHNNKIGDLGQKKIILVDGKLS